MPIRNKKFTVMKMYVCSLDKEINHPDSNACRTQKVWTRIMARLTVRRIQLAVYLDMKCSIESKIDLALHILETDLKKAHNSR